MKEIGTIISSDRSNLDATAEDKLILTVVIRYPKERYAPGDTLVIANTTSSSIE